MGPDDEYGQQQGGYPPQGGYSPAPVRTEVNVGRLWAGGVAAAVVAALVGLVGALVVRAIFQLASSANKSGTFSDDATVQLCVMAAVAALLATGLAHLLLVSTPSPLSYFGWIVGLLTVAAVVLPFLSSSSPLPIMLAEAIIHLVLGVAIGGLVSNAAAAASRLTLRG